MTVLLKKDEIDRIIERLAYQVLERHGVCDNLMLVGIQRRGADIAFRMAQLLNARLGREVPVGTLDINLYRDDWTSIPGKPRIGESHIPGDLDDVDVVLVDDVLFTGRTIRAALEALLDYGRPGKVELLVLIDRGHRELPIHADYVGRSVNTSLEEQVNVLLREHDDIDEVHLNRK